MTTYQIAVLAGDGIGPEVVKESLRVLQVVPTKLNGVRFTFERSSIARWAPGTI